MAANKIVFFMIWKGQAVVMLGREALKNKITLLGKQFKFACSYLILLWPNQAAVSSGPAQATQIL